MPLNEAGAAFAHLCAVFLASLLFIRTLSNDPFRELIGYYYGSAAIPAPICVDK